MHWCGQAPDSKLRRYQNRRTSRCGQTEQQQSMHLASTHRNNQLVSSGRTRQTSRMKWTLSLVIFVCTLWELIGSHIDPLFSDRHLWWQGLLMSVTMRHRSFESWCRQWGGVGCTISSPSLLASIQPLTRFAFVTRGNKLSYIAHCVTRLQINMAVPETSLVSRWLIYLWWGWADCCCWSSVYKAVLWKWRCVTG